MLPNKQRHGNWQKKIILSFLLPFFIAIASVIAIATPTQQVSAVTSDTLNFQGRLLTNTGALVADGIYTLEFNLYSAATGGTSLWTENRTGGNAVSVQNGYFSVYLGDVTAFPGSIPWDQELWLTMNVNGDGEMTPRFKLTAVPYAFRAGAVTDAAGNAYTGDDLAQLAPGTVQTVNAAVAALRLNQTGSGAVLQLQGDGTDIFVVDKTGGAVLGAGLRIGTSASTTAGTLRWTGTDFEGYDGSGWASLTSGSGPSGSAFEDGGNSFGGLAVLGTNDGNSLAIRTSGTNRVFVDTNGNVGIGSSLTAPNERLQIDGGINIGNSTNTNAGTLRWTGTDFEGYNGAQWVSLTSTGSTTIIGSQTATFVSGVLNLGTNTAGVEAGMLVNTTATAFSIATGTGSPTFVAPAAGSFRSCTVVSNANRTAGTATLRWRVNGASVGAGACVIDATNVRTSASVLDPGVVTFNAGDTIGVAFDSSGLSPNTTERLVYWAVDYEGGAPGGGGLGYVQNGNDFGETAVLGTTDGFGLNIITNNATALSVSAAGLVSFVNNATFNDGLTVAAGGIDVTGNSTINGTLSGLSGLTFASGNIDLNSGGITNTGSITGVGSDITATNGLTVASGGGGNLSLSASSGLLLLDANTVRRTAVGTTIIDLEDADDTTLVLTNSAAGSLNLEVEGLVTATSFSGAGGGLTGLDAGNITTGTLSDSVLSTNVALLNTAQTFSGLQTFSNGLVVGNTSSATAGAIRWTGVDLEVYDGSVWKSLTQGGSGAPLLEGVLAFGKVDANGTALNIDGATVTRNSIGSYTVTFGTAAADANYTILLTIADSSGFNDPNIAVTAQSTSGFSIEIRLGDNGGGADTLADRVWHFTVIDSNAAAGGGGGGSGLEFVQNGNAFGSTAILGTTDNNGLEFITNGATAFSIDALGDGIFENSLTVSADLFVSGAVEFLGGSLNLGTTTQAGQLLISDGSNNTGTIETATLSANRIYILPDEDGTICLSSGNCASSAEYAEIGGNTVVGSMVLGTNNANALIFKTDNTNQLSIDTSGNINVINGALQTNGTARLTSSGELQNITGLTIISGGASITGNTNIIGALTSSGALTVSAGGASITGGLNNNNGGITNAGSIAGATTITASGDINTTGGGLQTNSITRLTNAGALQNITTITASGNINTTAGVYQVNGVSGVSGTCTGGNNAYLRDITVSGGIITDAICRSSGASLSDERLKENVVSLDASILDNIGLVNTVNFDFKCEDPAYAELGLDCETQTGVIAQELAAIFPELVYQGEDGYYRVKYDALNIYTLKAVAEIAKTINSLGDVSARSVSTSETIRLTENGELTNINGLTLQSGGASIVGGVDNNNGGLTNVGDVLGANTIEAQNIRLSGGASAALELIRDSKNVFTVFNDGALALRVNNERAFSVADEQGIDLFSVNTDGGIVRVGGQNSSPSAILFVLSRKNTAGDPVGVNGAQYYNEYMQRFRCYQDDRWVDCVPAAVTEYVLASNVVDWQLPEETTELPGQPRTWLDLRTTREYRLIVSVGTAAPLGATCSLEYQLENSAEWITFDSSSIIDAAETTRSEWLKIADEVRAQEEVQLRVVCSGGDNEASVDLSAVRVQVR